MSDTDYGRCDTCGQQWPCPAHVGAEAGMEIAFSGFRQGYTAALQAVLDKVEVRLERALRGARSQERQVRLGHQRVPSADVSAARIDLLGLIIQELKGYPNQGISCSWTLEYKVAQYHIATITGIPAYGPLRYEVECSCSNADGPQNIYQGWSVDVVGAKALARKHVADLLALEVAYTAFNEEKGTWMIGGFDR